jgi:hypothetical protein
MIDDTNTGDPLDSIGEELDGDPNVPIDFATFVLSLSSSATYHLGLLPHPDSGEPCANLPMAKQTIDILSLLQEKTKGNLNGEEERLLGDILYNLRMAFIREAARCKERKA